MTTFVEAKTWTQNNTWYIGGTNPITVETFSLLNENDLLIAYGRQGVAADVTDLVANGWTVIRRATASGQSHFVAYQYASATPATTYDFTTDTSTSSSDSFVTIAAFRGVKLIDPFDVVFDEALHYISNGTATTHTPADITLNTVNAWLISIIFTNVSSGGPTSLSQSGHIIDHQGGQDNGPYGGISHKVEAVPGSKSPADWGLTVTSTALLYTLALRDVDSIFISIPDVDWNPPTGWDYITYGGDHIPESSILLERRGTHTGSGNSATLTDSNVNLAADEWAGHRVYNYHDDSTGIIGTHAVGSGPFTLSTVLADGFENDFDTGDSYDIVVDINEGDQIVYENTTNLSGSVFITNVGNATITGASGTHTFDYKIRDATDNKVSATKTVTITV